MVKEDIISKKEEIKEAIIEPKNSQLSLEDLLKQEPLGKTKPLIEDKAQEIKQEEVENKLPLEDIVEKKELVTEVKPIIHEEKIPTKELDVTDDQFFDDFFED